MAEAGERAPGRPVLELELVLAEAIAGADGVHGHPDLHPKARGEGQGGAQGLGAQRPLAGDRRPGVGAAEAPDRPVGEAEREAETTADPAREGGHREVALPLLDRLHQRRQARRRGTKVAVAEQEEGRRRLDAQRRLRRRAHVGALAVGAAAADHLGPGRQRQLRGAVAGGVVGDPDRRGGEGPAQGRDRLPDPIGLVAGGDYDGERHRRDAADPRSQPTDPGRNCPNPRFPSPLVEVQNGARDHDAALISGPYGLGRPSPGPVHVLALERDPQLGTDEIDLGFARRPLVHDGARLEQRPRPPVPRGAQQQHPQLLLGQLRVIRSRGAFRRDDGPGGRSEDRGSRPSPGP